MATEEPIVAVEPVPEPTNVEPPVEEAKPEEVKAKITKAKKATKPRKAASHPSYEEVSFDSIQITF